MDTALGLLGLTVFVLCVIGLAAGVTWLVVKIDAWVRRLRQRPATSPES
ncbi:MAG TPA: hypothetical protein VE615_03065 [Gaiellaceae bacterium]|nr:hypothetical protein [Gaiellaceae bacterium]